MAYYDTTPNTFNKSYGFTLIELLIVMGILTTLTTLVLVSLDPITRFAQARNVRRLSDVSALLTAIQEYAIDKNGKLPSGITTTEQQLGTCSSGGNAICTTAASACLDLSTDLSKYLQSIPKDPDEGSAATTYYSVVKDANNIVTVTACNAELGEIIQASR